MMDDEEILEKIEEKYELEPDKFHVWKIDNDNAIELGFIRSKLKDRIEELGKDPKNHLIVGTELEEFYRVEKPASQTSFWSLIKQAFKNLLSSFAEVKK